MVTIPAQNNLFKIRSILLEDIYCVLQAFEQNIYLPRGTTKRK